MRRVHSLFILLLFCASLQAAEDVDAPAEVSKETSMTEEDGGSLVIDVDDAPPRDRIIVAYLVAHPAEDLELAFRAIRAQAEHMKIS